MLHSSYSFWPKSGLDLDGFIREIAKRQKSFDLRQKFVWCKPSKSNSLLVETVSLIFESPTWPFRPKIHAPPGPLTDRCDFVRIFFASLVLVQCSLDFKIFLVRNLCMNHAVWFIFYALWNIWPRWPQLWGHENFFHNMNHLVMTAVQSWNIFSRDYCLDQLECYQFCGFRRFWGTLWLQTVQ